MWYPIVHNARINAHVGAHADSLPGLERCPRRARIHDRMRTQRISNTHPTCPRDPVRIPLGVVEQSPVDRKGVAIFCSTLHMSLLSYINTVI